MNSRSIRGKTSAVKLRELIHEFDLDFLLITETWLHGDVSDGVHITELTPPAYALVNFPRTSGGGAVVLRSCIRIPSTLRRRVLDVFPPLNGLRLK